MSSISKRQIDLMEHTIGLTQDRIKRNVYEYYRNYFCAGNKEMDEFEDLVSKNLATKHIRNKQVYYNISKDGLQLIADANKIKILKRY